MFLYFGGRDQSIVDNGLSPNEEEKEGRSHELEALQAELRKMNEENQRLRVMLNQVTNNYTTLKSHLLSLMQQRIEEVGMRYVQRQFMDSGPAALTERRPRELKPEPVPPTTTLKTRKSWRSVQLSASEFADAVEAEDIKWKSKWKMVREDGGVMGEGGGGGEVEGGKGGMVGGEEELVGRKRIQRM
ncbi:hypothetical protein J5N97_016712 [Dioscorea zingiberensis]|uniref:Uncharacterized protein n=1 Tax=Dioscorea zingiberensis TaxID=325984 RepID=A0A9D5HFX5_9LILI|nr:hypothetical protein J5N97_016712 [Dioscorea zingiberensis]